MVREFVALMLDAETAARLRARVLPELEPLRADLRLYDERDLHVTLGFLGTLEPGVAEPLAAALAPALGERPAPRLRLGRPGAFPDRGRPRVLWAGVEELHGGGDLAALARVVRAVCAEHGLQLDRRPFRPHVTLARVRGPARGRIPVSFYDREIAETWQPEAARWVLSPGAGGTPAYRPTHRFPLAPPRSPAPATDPAPGPARGPQRGA